MTPIRQLIAEKERERERIQLYIDGLWLAIRIMETAEAAIKRIEARAAARSEGDDA